jgi:hypothetical protein
MRALLILATALSCLSAPAPAQVLGFDGDGFEACPHQVLTIASTSNWTSQFGPFPSVLGVHRILVPSSGSSVFAFQAPMAPQSGTLQVQNDVDVTGASVISLSRCSSVYPINPSSCLAGPAAANALDFTTDPNGQGCLLEPGQTYFFNITFGVEAAPVNGQPWCGGFSCGVRVNSLVR